jgi:hypothetical protein
MRLDQNQKLQMEQWLKGRSFKSLFTRKIKIVLIVMLLGTVTIGGFAICGVVAGVSYITQQAQNIDLTTPVQKGRAEIEALKPTWALSWKSLTSPTCWSKIEQLFTLEPWTQSPVPDNLRALQGACLESAQASNTENISQ